MRLPLIAAVGLLGASFFTLVMSLSGQSDRTVSHLVTAPGVEQRVPVGAVAGALGVPSGNSPFAVYTPPANLPSPAPSQAASAQAQTAAQAPPPAPPQGGPPNKKHH